MAATVTIRRWTGSEDSPTKTDITSINTRANAEDAHSTGSITNSILIPAAGTNYSYWVSTRLSLDAIEGGTVDNLKWYTDGSNNFGTGVTCKGATARFYVQATGTPGTTGTQLTTEDHSSLADESTDVFEFTADSPKQVPGSTSSLGDFGDFFVYQIEIESTAASGATASETFTWKYDDSSS
ncbi:TPA: hypothetical protein DIV55_04460 [Patescibacteria group bacterium]|uniref:Uncharacterized protein n=1 Tax=Candidatus Gottesmanbacteria bacterium GW2011_GWA1_43_11 TaxID=1618436 RepID=A0A0G1CFU6_9BACT|nr:MAG: hypothetical protein UV59_C0020G0031 [Candidatus Gottesmanbacteria bacterium GW2011_GWA1_43_11]HCS78966.1 hypothetical protein [Patescibacteria group bacterium]